MDKSQFRLSLQTSAFLSPRTVKLHQSSRNPSLPTKLSASRDIDFSKLLLENQRTFFQT